uniref:Major facilitator superfamily (MFS) profile domain-containing protein n=1 Tax=Chromera velia CCMP2878 TaxID=1169474 RepID=A0A0G4IBJ7_9ALVE|mmetsp:Transcript_6470/g.12819  ORF Transcript_6470/g.12819 Transcript_6470/m.12819 type:complete len:562 (+) Transcript_6470:166-1851(+)|eukprot:Cvel_12854.t1-p1 / transcript=Cvel_12854.t1 / gene=Cvel_12854 / organism=Chromera_velia_CCMP2878 / gene_product=High affinity nitrate transporter 2.5, putative / transcript_product=High affinity nitrate transporter 2.5, putative / location=Cvel_scaffold857:55341-57515(+) / protein_length=561 / sequence_SO=supercontig / SO=protein_coding / is_pseudo=false
MGANLGLFGKPDVDAVGRAKQMKFFSFAKPHMRGFHFSWSCFFLAFLTWFSIPALSNWILINPKDPTNPGSLNLVNRKEFATSNILNVGSTIAMRVLIGPVCDHVGPRLAMVGLMLCGAIPICFFGLVNTAIGLFVLRFFVGVIGATFVPCQYWTTLMFSPTTVGTANAFAGGWGNLGGGATFIIMPLIFRAFRSGLDLQSAITWSFVVPGVVTISWALTTYFFSVDCPQGKYKDRIRPGETAEEARERIAASQINLPQMNSQTSVVSMPAARKEESVLASLWDSIKDVFSHQNTIILIIQYGGCFGVELTVNSFLAAYFFQDFYIKGSKPPVHQISPDENEARQVASTIAACFGLMNLFARALGGIFSDFMNKHLNMSGRLIAHMLCLTLEAVFLLIFSFQTEIWTALGVVIVFSLFVQMSEGTSYGIVPYVSKKHTGVVAGLVGAGGNLGAVCLGIAFRQMPDRWDFAFRIVAFFVFACAALTPLLYIQGQFIVPTKRTYEAVRDERERLANKPHYGHATQPKDISVSDGDHATLPGGTESMEAGGVSPGESRPASVAH